MQEKVYLARYGREWRKKGTEQTLGSKLTLKGDETLAMYEQIPAPKPAAPSEAISEKNKTKKPAEEQPAFGSFGGTN